MPADRVEVHFFDLFYDKGIKWYEKVLPAGEFAGEKTPEYLSDNLCARRIHQSYPDIKLLCILRNPVKRAYSHYKHLYRFEGLNATFEDSLLKNKEILRRGFYSGFIEEYYKYFNRSCIKILIFEEVMNHKISALKEISKFLNIDPAGFEFQKAALSQNASFIPKYRLIYSTAKKITRVLQKYNFYFLINLINKTGLKKLISQKEQTLFFRRMRPETEKELKRLYTKDVKRLSKLTGKDLIKIWFGESI